MNLIKEQWTNCDIVPFLEYLSTFQQTDKETWARKILNTKLKLLVIPTKEIYEIKNQILLGNYISYLNLEIFDHYEAIAIYGGLLTKIPDFPVMVTYLSKYLNVMENWAHCDILSFPIKPHLYQDYLSLSLEYSKDQRPFVRRLSLMILFQMGKDKAVLPVIYERLLELKEEQEYYVIMMAGWLLCECIIQHKAETLSFLISHKELNKKIVNKAIQKCRESRRFTQEEKEELLMLKKNLF